MISITTETFSRMRTEQREERERGMTRWRSLPPSSAGGPDSQAKQRIYCCLWFFLRSFSMPSLLLMFHLLFYVFQENTETLLHIFFLAFHPRKWLFIFKCICICWVWLRRRGAEGRKRKRGIEDDGRGRLARFKVSLMQVMIDRYVIHDTPASTTKQGEDKERRKRVTKRQETDRSQDWWLFWGEILHQFISFDVTFEWEKREEKSKNYDREQTMKEVVDRRRGSKNHFLSFLFFLQVLLAVCLMIAQ